MQLLVELESVPCCLCRSTRSEPMLTGPDRAHGVPGQFALCRCLDCGLIYQNPRPSAASLPAIYPADYGPYQPVEVTPQTIHVDWRGTCRFICRLQPRGGRLLDIGCGPGT